MPVIIMMCSDTCGCGMKVIPFLSAFILHPLSPWNDQPEFILGDRNTCDTSSYLPNLHRYVTTPTSGMQVQWKVRLQRICLQHVNNDLTRNKGSPALMYTEQDFQCYIYVIMIERKRRRKRRSWRPLGNVVDASNFVIGF